MVLTPMMGLVIAGLLHDPHQRHLQHRLAARLRDFVQLIDDE